jgi:hypothetical protein
LLDIFRVTLEKLRPVDSFVSQPGSDGVSTQGPEGGYAVGFDTVREIMLEEEMKHREL